MYGEPDVGKTIEIVHVDVPEGYTVRADFDAVRTLTLDEASLGVAPGDMVELIMSGGEWRVVNHWRGVDTRCKQATERESLSNLYMVANK